MPASIKLQTLKMLNFMFEIFNEISCPIVFWLKNILLTNILSMQYEERLINQSYNLT